MSRLGYEGYAVHGTDAGSGIADLLAMIAPERVIGTHLSGTVAAMPFGPPLASEGLEGIRGWRQMAASQPQAAGAADVELSGPPKGVAVFAADTTIKSIMDPTGTIEREFFHKHR